MVKIEREGREGWEQERRQGIALEEGRENRAHQVREDISGEEMLRQICRDEKGMNTTIIVLINSYIVRSSLVFEKICSDMI